MKKKFKSVILGIVVGVVGIFTAVGLSGCGADLDTLKENYSAMQSKIEKYDEVFKTETVDGIQTNLKVDYGTFVNGKLTDGVSDSFDELETKYNSILIISNDYIVQNITYVQNYNEKNLSKAAKNSLEDLCDDIEEFTDYLKTFVSDRNALNNYFEQFQGENEAQTQTKLVTFKKSYGKLVSKNLSISMSLASCIEATEIYDSLEKTEVTPTTLKIVKEYTRAKMLPIFSRFMLNEISNQFNWENYKDTTETLVEIDALLTNLESVFNNSYKTTFVTSPDPTTLRKGTVKEFFETVDEFLIEADNYFSALSDLDIREFAVSYEGDMGEYLKDNELAEIDIHKIDQFIKITMPAFITEFSSRI